MICGPVGVVVVVVPVVPVVPVPRIVVPPVLVVTLPETGWPAPPVTAVPWPLGETTTVFGWLLPAAPVSVPLFSELVDPLVLDEPLDVLAGRIAAWICVFWPTDRNDRVPMPPSRLMKPPSTRSKWLRFTTLIGSVPAALALPATDAASRIDPRGA